MVVIFFVMGGFVDVWIWFLFLIFLGLCFCFIL